ncbi:DNA repair exonuclease [Candidatus Woesearchaeota archaeon]|nr:DNA repair exonuclease [Candidatus Woesearchaeota archaeon]
MKFAHMADCHIGGWREDKLNELTIQVFRDAIDICIKEHVAFILIAGDLFDTALPNIDLIKEVASILEKVKRRDIEVYIIPGSHDFSPSGKTFLDVLENSGLVINVNKYDGDNKLLFFEDKTGVKITGLLGKRSGLEREDYKNLEKEHLENEKGFKIFMFHTTLEEFKPKYLENVKGQNYADLPKNFNYYAGGHVHYLFDTEKDGYGKIVYPGPLFPNNFKEIEELKHGGFCIVNDNLELTRIPIKAKDVLNFIIEGDNPEEINLKLDDITNLNVDDKLILLRIKGELENGKVSDVKVKEIIKKLISKGAYAVLKNTEKLKVKELEEIRIEGNVEDVEREIIKNNLGRVNIEGNEEELINGLFNVLNMSKEEGERVNDFEERLWDNVKKVLKYDN